MIIYGIDPGSEKSAIVKLDDGSVLSADILDNAKILNRILCMEFGTCAIERPVCYVGGKEIGETLIWYGRFDQAADFTDTVIVSVTRAEVTKHFGVKKSSKKNGKQKSPDSQIRAVLAKRFGTKTVEGTNIVADMWQALGVAVCAAERVKK